MTEPTPLYLTAIAYELGEHEHRVADLDAVLPGVRTSLGEAGVVHYRTTDGSPIDLARATLARSLAAVDPSWASEIRHLIYATNTMWSTDYANATALADLVTSLGLHRAYPYGLFLSYCANLQAALDLAAAWIRAGEAEHVAVVCTDKTDPASDRLVQPKISVHSDAAASFLLTRVPVPGAPRLRYTGLHLDPGLGGVHPEERFMEYLSGVSEGVVKAVTTALGAVGLIPADVAVVLPNNYNTWVSRIVGELAGFRRGQLYLDNIPRLAHGLAADGLINLADWLATADPGPGEHLLLLGTGPTQWGCSIVDTR